MKKFYVVECKWDKETVMLVRAEDQFEAEARANTYYRKKLWKNDEPLPEDLDMQTTMLVDESAPEDENVITFMNDR